MLSLADGRDLLTDIIQKQWQVGNKLVDIVKLIPKFCQRIQELE